MKTEQPITELLPYNLAIDFNELKKAKSRLLTLLAENNLLDNSEIDGIISLLDEIQDQATDVHELSPNHVFDLESEIL